MMLEALRQIPLFALVLDSESECLRFLEEGREVHLQPGELLGAEGDPPFFTVILEGEVRITKKIGTQETTIATQGAGVYLGEMPLLLGTPFIGSVYAVTECHLFVLQPDTFWKM
ncbi:MAG TPA: cyclic nucleotide-binding domain-containing protein, partial [Armatimonadota bacterium]|nr:cyclic nucleotide-binding domain-containing protein [Armatimonadota bacterium]